MALWKFPPQGSNCCGQPCTTFMDNFNRGDSTNLGANWSEVAGDAEIVSNKLEVGSGDFVVSTTDMAGGEMLVRATLSMSDGEVCHVVLNYSDTSNYHYAEVTFTRGTPNSVTIALHEVLAGSDSTLDTETINLTTSGGSGTDDLIISACIDGTDFGASVSTGKTIVLHRGITLIAGGTKGGIEADLDTVQVDDYTITDCGCSFSSVCGCDANGLPDQLQIDITADMVGDIVNCSDAQCDTIWDGTHVLDRIEDADACKYQKVIASSGVCSGSATLTAEISVIGSNTAVGVQLSMDGGLLIFSPGNLGLPVQNCLTFSGVNVPFLSASFFPECTQGTTTVEATAL